MNRSGLVDRGISSYGVVCLWICPLFLDLNFECSHEYSKGDRSHKEKKKKDGPNRRFYPKKKKIVTKNNI